MSSNNRFLLALVLLFSLTLAGSLGYMAIEEWDFRDSLFMTAITLSTVGYGEVKPLSPDGEIFTIGLIILGFVFAGFSVASITAFIVQGELRELLKGRRMQKQISNMKNHYILCGFGAVGAEIATEFVAAGQPFVAIDRGTEGLADLRHQNYPHIEGDATDEEMLIEAGIHRARGLITAIHSDPENVFVTLTARQLEPNLQIIARASEKGTEAKLLRAGADRVVSPFAIAGKRMAYTALRPGVVNFFDIALSANGIDMHLEECVITADSQLCGKNLQATELGMKTGAIIIGVRDNDGQAIMRSAGDFSLDGITPEFGNSLIALGSEDQLAHLRNLAGSA